VAHGAPLALETRLDVAEVEADASGAHLEMGEPTLNPVVDGPTGQPEAQCRRSWSPGAGFPDEVGDLWTGAKRGAEWL
jgi:hypothetical protein